MKYIEEKYAKWYGRDPNTHFYGNPDDFVTTIKDILPNGNVLDLGAGDGRSALYLAAQGFNVTAVDLSATALQKLQRLATEKKLKIKTELADLRTWSIEKNYDAIIAIVVLQHLQNDSALRLLNEIKTHTNPGGVNLIVAFPKSSYLYLEDIKTDPEAFYPDDHWLKEFYSDWNIVENDSFIGNLMRKSKVDGQPMKSVIERVLTRKP